MREGCETAGPDEIRAALERVSNSTGFRNGRRIRALLEYLVNETLSGNQDRIKATSIAIDVFGRDETFDQQSDPIVRVEAGRLRNKLKEYYQGEGVNDPLFIDIPKGGYVPKFTLRQDSVSSAGENLKQLQSSPIRPGRRNILITLATGLVVGLVISSIAGFLIYRSNKQENASHYADLSLPGAESKPFVVVNPLALTVGDSESERLAKGLVEALITDLSKLSNLSVMAHGSVLESHQGGDLTSITELRSRYGVTHMLRGTIERDNDLVIVNMQLVDTGTAKVLWAERSSRELNQIIDLEEELALTIVQKMSVQLLPEERERLSREHSTNFEAWLLYRQGLITLMPPGDPARVQAAAQLFDRATEVDPGFAGGYAGQSFNHSVRVLFMLAPDPDSELSAAIALARKAITVDPNFGAGYAMLALAQMLGGQTDEALASARKSISIQPGDAFARFVIGMSLLIAGQPEQSIPHLQEALRLDPLESRMPYMNVMGIAYYSTKDYINAVKTVENSFARGGPTGPHMDILLAAAYAQLGEQERATGIIKGMLRYGQEFPVGAWLKRWLTDEVQREQTGKLLEDLGLSRSGVIAVNRLKNIITN